jgi:hypothetical protein
MVNHLHIERKLNHDKRPQLFRMMHDSEPTRYAQDNVRTELEFVLLERLESTDRC